MQDLKLVGWCTIFTKLGQNFPLGPKCLWNFVQKSRYYYLDVRFVIRFFRLSLLHRQSWPLKMWVPCFVEPSPSWSPSCVAAEEGIEHGLLHTLLVLPTPGNHCPLTVGCVQMVAITGKRKAVETNLMSTLHFLKLY